MTKKKKKNSAEIFLETGSILFDSDPDVIKHKLGFKKLTF